MSTIVLCRERGGVESVKCWTSGSSTRRLFRTSLWPDWRLQANRLQAKGVARSSLECHAFQEWEWGWLCSKLQDTATPSVSGLNLLCLGWTSPLQGQGRWNPWASLGKNPSMSKQACFEESTILSKSGRWVKNYLATFIFIVLSNTMDLEEGEGVSDKVPISSN